MRSLLLLLFAASCAGPDVPLGDAPRFDVVVYGGTSAGVAAAVQAARLDRSVVVVDPTRHVGGLSSAGLGATDVGNKEVIGGLSREFYRRIRAHYENDAAWVWQERSAFRGRGHRPGEDAAWTFEPHVAEQVFRAMLAEEDVPVWYGERLDLDRGAVMRGPHLVGLVLESGRTVRGGVFVDATYEGDLMACAGVTYTVGREPNARYGETLNGVQTAHAVHHQFTHEPDPWVVPGDPSSGLLPGIHPGGPGEEGSGDHRVQAWCFRMCTTDVPDNRLPWPRPEGYDEREYELLLRNFEAGDHRMPWHRVAMPNRKTDTNNNKAFSTDWIGANYDYPEAGHRERARIVAAHERYQKGLMWTLANHPRVPEAVRAEFQRWGPCRDEFTDNGGWPHLLYIRESRRMVSGHVMTEHHCRGTRPVPEPVGMGAYNMDSHNVQRYVDEQGRVRNEGDVQVRVPPYGISFRSLVPCAGECANLLVPVCVSASHIAYGSIRMEPVFMILGQSAAVAGHLALEHGVPVGDVPYPALRARLEELGQVLPPR